MLSLCTAPEGTVSGGGGCLLICRPEAGKLKLILLQTQFGQHLCLTQSQFVRNGGGSGGEETRFFHRECHILGASLQPHRALRAALKV